MPSAALDRVMGVRRLPSGLVDLAFGENRERVQIPREHLEALDHDAATCCTRTERRQYEGTRGGFAPIAESLSGVGSLDRVRCHHAVVVRECEFRQPLQSMHDVSSVARASRADVMRLRRLISLMVASVSSIIRRSPTCVRITIGAPGDELPTKMPRCRR